MGSPNTGDTGDSAKTCGDCRFIDPGYYRGHTWYGGFHVTNTWDECSNAANAKVQKGFFHDRIIQIVITPKTEACKYFQPKKPS